MPEPQATEAEPRVQPKFSLVTAVAGLALFAAIVWADVFIDTLPDGPPTPPTLAQVSLDPIELDSSGLKPLSLAGVVKGTP